MKYLNPVILALVTMLAALAIAFASADNLFKGHSWLVPYLYGACAILLIFAVINALFISNREQKESAATAHPAASVHQENRQEFNPQFNISVGNSSSTATANVLAPEKKDSEPRCAIELSDVRVAPHQTDAGTPIKTACAVFENKYIDGQRLRTPTLHARLIFRHSDGHLVLDLPDAAWWPNETRDASFTANAPRQLLLFFSPSPEVTEANLFARAVHLQQIGGYHRSVLLGESYPISEEIGSIEVQLLTDTELVFQKVLKFEEGDGFPKFIGEKQ